MSTRTANTSKAYRIVRPAAFAVSTLVAASFALALNFSANFAQPELIVSASAAEPATVATTGDSAS